MNYPKVCLDNKGIQLITFYLSHKRFRLYSRDKIGIDLKPNSFPFPQRRVKSKILAAEIYKYAVMGYTPLNVAKNKFKKKKYC